MPYPDRHRFTWFNLMWECDELDHNERLIGSYLWKRATKEYRSWPTNAELIDRCHRSMGTVKGGLKGLRQKLWIVRSKRSLPQGGSSYLYDLRVPARHYPIIKSADPDDIAAARTYLEDTEVPEDLDGLERELFIDERLPQIVTMFRQG